jgi:hypothetical protein
MRQHENKKQRKQAANKMAEELELAQTKHKEAEEERMKEERMKEERMKETEKQRQVKAAEQVQYNAELRLDKRREELKKAEKILEEDRIKADNAAKAVFDLKGKPKRGYIDQIWNALVGMSA